MSICRYKFHFPYDTSKLGRDFQRFLKPNQLETSFKRISERKNLQEIWRILDVNLAILVQNVVGISGHCSDAMSSVVFLACIQISRREWHINEVTRTDTSETETETERERENKNPNKWHSDLLLLCVLYRHIWFHHSTPQLNEIL